MQLVQKINEWEVCEAKKEKPLNKIQIYQTLEVKK